MRKKFLIATILVFMCAMTGLFASCGIGAKNVAVTGISLNKTELTLDIGETEALVAIISPADATNRKVTWGSSNPFIANIDVNGQVTACAAGTTIITASTKDGGLTATCIVTVNAAEVLPSSVVLTKNELSIKVGASDTISATVLPANATNKTVTWTSNKPSIATVINGTVRGISAGEATIAATTVNGKVAMCRVTVTDNSGTTTPQEIKVSSIALAQTTLTLEKGMTHGAIIAQVLPADATNKTLAWESVNPAIVSINSETGAITAVETGTTTIMAKATDGSGVTAYCTVTVEVAVTGIQLSESNIVINKGNEKGITATILPEGASNKEIKWTTSNASIATVEGGVVRAVAKGEVTITAISKYNENIKATCTVTVWDPVTDVTLDKTNIQLILGKTESTMLTATVLPSTASNAGVRWTTSNADVVTVVNGLVTAVAKGEATITAISKDNERIIATCTVNVIKPVQSIVLNNAQLEVDLGAKINLKATVNPVDATNTEIEWRLVDVVGTNVVTYSDGEFIANAEGTATVTAVSKYDQTITATCTIKVIVPVSSVTLTTKTLALYKGDVKNVSELGMKVWPENATYKTVKWTTTDNNVVTVADGVITAVGEGTADIIVTSDNGAKTEKCSVTVTKKIISVTGVKLDKNTATLAEGTNSLVLNATVEPANADNTNVSWTSSNPDVLAVENGTVTLVNRPLVDTDVTITVTTLDKQKTATCVITVKAKTIAVDSISLTATEITLSVGGSSQLIASIVPANATNKGVTFTVADVIGTNVISYANGLVTANAVGTATVTFVSDENASITATCTITVTSNVVTATGVTLDKETLTLVEGDTATLVATVEPANATDKTVIWESRSPSIATVENGKITAVKAGEAVITATAGGKTVQCVVTVNPKVIPVTSVTLDVSEKNMYIGDTFTLNVTVLPDNRTDKAIYWSSNNTDLATVDNGVVKAVGAGEVTITVKAGDKTATCVINITKKAVAVTDVTLSKTELTLNVNEHETLTATVAPADADNKEVVWSSNKPSVATVEGGVVRAVGAGTAIITVTTVDGEKTAQCTVTVIQTISGVTMDNALTLEIGEGATVTEKTLTFAVSPNGATYSTVEWVSNKNSVATVSNSGKVTAVGKGTATITVTIDGKYTAQCTVTVIKPIKEISIDKTLTLEVGAGASTTEKTLTLNVLPADADYTDIVWSSNKESVATVVNGKVTAIGVGTAEITVIVDGKYTATCTVTVEARVTGIQPSATTLKIDEGKTASLTASVLPSTATNGKFTYVITLGSDVISYDGATVTALKAGTAVITFTTEEGGKTATCTITVEARVTGLTLSSTAITIDEGKTATVTASILPANATVKDISWTITSGLDVISYDGTTVTALKAGTAVITFTTLEGGKTATCTITVEARVTGLTLSATTLKLDEGKTASLTASILPANATVKDISYAITSGNDVVSYDGNTVTALKAGTAVITFTTKEGGKTATCTITVEARVTGLTLSATTLKLDEGKTASLTASILPANATVKDISYAITSGNDVVSYDGTTVTALKAGTAVITFTTLEGGKTATCTITVEARVTGLTLSATTLKLDEGKTASLTASILPANATVKDISYAITSGNDVVSYDGNTVTALKAGTAVITFTTLEGGKTATCTITVNAVHVAVTGINLNKTTANMNLNGTLTLTASVTPANATNKTLNWTSSDNEIATVANGVVTAKKTGSVTITVATAENPAITKTCTITIIGLTLDKTATSVAVGKTVQLKAIITPYANVFDGVTWSSNSSVATVDMNGNVKGVSAGTAVITAKLADGITATCTVTVTASNATAVTLNYNSLTLIIFDNGAKGTQQLTATPNGAYQNITWSSSSPGVVSVGADGKVTAVNYGTATITCTVTTASGTVTTTCTVKVVPESIWI